MLIFNYVSKKAIKEAIGSELDYRETSLFGEEFTPDGDNIGSNRPALTGIGKREYFAKVTLKDGLIIKVA